MSLIEEIQKLEAFGRMLSTVNIEELRKCVQILNDLINKSDANSKMNETGNNMATVAIEDGVVKVKVPSPIN